MKSECKKNGIPIDKSKSDSESEQLLMLQKKLEECGHEEILKKLDDQRREIIEETKQHPDELMRWLYENQGEMRFGSENRLYLVLSNLKDFENSWQLKRNYELLEECINTYLNIFSPSNLKRINFMYKGISYSALSDIIFVTQ